MGKFVIQLSDEHVKSIGKIVVIFAVLEFTISSCIHRLIGAIGTDHPVGEIITAELSFSQKVTLLSSLYKFRLNDTEKLTELEKLLRRVALAEEKRNAVIHSIWASGDTRDTATRIKTTAKRKQGLKFQFQKLSVEELDEIADFIDEVAYDLQTFEFSMYIPDFRKKTG